MPFGFTNRRAIRGTSKSTTKKIRKKAKRLYIESLLQSIRRPPVLKARPLTPSPPSPIDNNDGTNTPHSVLFTEKLVPFMKTYYPDFLYSEFYRPSEPNRTYITITQPGIETCASLIIKNSKDSKVIHLDDLNKCGDHTGSQVLTLVEEFAKYAGFEKITLQDASDIKGVGSDCKIPLALFSLLVSGQTWYNSKGYFSPSFDTEYAHNKEIIKRPVLEFLEDIMHILPEEERNDLFTRLFELNRTRIKKTTTVKSFFSAIKREIRGEELDCEQNPLHLWLTQILSVIKSSGCLVRSVNRELDVIKIPKHNVVLVSNAVLEKVM